MLLKNTQGSLGAERALAICFGLAMVGSAGYLLRGGTDRATTDAERALRTREGGRGQTRLGQVVEPGPVMAVAALSSLPPPGPARLAAPAAPGKEVLRIQPLHYKGPVTFDGPYRISAAALTDKYRGVSADKFGTTDVKLPTGQTYNVRDMHYDLGDGRFGMRIIPVADEGTVKAPDGTEVPGHKLMDDTLRAEMKLKPDDPIFALILYQHPELHSGDLKALGGEMLKTEMGATHMGAYIGEGRTTNAPFDYHNRRWSVKGYPASVQIVSLAGVDQATLNRNALHADSVLNKGVVFPPDYKKDIFRTIDLNTNFQFYRDWLRGESYLKDDPTWKTYCAEHKTIVTNIMLNLPHNEASFKEVFGEEEGAALWKTFKERFKEANGREFTAADETSFEPLWKKEGLKAEEIRPLTYDQWKAYDKARREGGLASYTGPRPLPPGRGMAWAPETTADLLFSFAQTYTSFVDAGGVVTSSVVMSFKDIVKDRMGLSDKDYLNLALPVVNKIMVADAMVNAKEDSGWLERSQAALYLAYGGKMEDLAPGGTKNQAIWDLAKGSLRGAEVQLPQIQAQPKMSREEAYAWLRKAIEPDLERARSQAVNGDNKVEFNSPPAVAQRASLGLTKSSKYVTIRTVATAVDQSEVTIVPPPVAPGSTP